MSIKSPALRYHGGKFRLAPWIMQFFPPHNVYCEPFGGAASVLIRKPRSYAEVYNDLDGDIVNFFRVLRDPDTRAELVQALNLTPYARIEFEEAWAPAESPVERARRTAIRAQMGFGSAGATKGSTGFRIDSRRAYGTAQHLWTEYPAAIEAIGLRFQDVLIENRDAGEVMQQHDTPDTMHYIDPPYVHETRCRAGGNHYYRHEMSDEAHEALLARITRLAGKVVISGYDTDMYHDILKGWAVRRRPSRVAARKGTLMRMEVVWINPAGETALRFFGMLDQEG